MRPRLFNFFCSISLLIVLVSIAIGLRSVWISDDFRWGSAPHPSDDALFTWGAGIQCSRGDVQIYVLSFRHDLQVFLPRGFSHTTTAIPPVLRGRIPASTVSQWTLLGYGLVHEQRHNGYARASNFFLTL